MYTLYSYTVTVQPVADVGLGIGGEEGGEEGGRGYIFDKVDS